MKVVSLLKVHLSGFVVGAFILTTILIASPLAEAGWAGGPVTNIVWSFWGGDPSNKICFVVEGKALWVDNSSTAFSKMIVAGLLSSLHTGHTITVEHFDSPDYDCGMIGSAYKTAGLDFHNVSD